MAEERDDGFEAHPAFGGLGGEGVVETVGVRVVDPGDGADAGDDSVDGVSIDGAVLSGEQLRAAADVFVSMGVQRSGLQPRCSGVRSERNELRHIA